MSPAGEEPRPVLEIAAAPRTPSGAPTYVPLTVTNVASEPRTIAVTILGLEASWIDPPVYTVPLAPGESAAVTMTLHPPPGTAAATYPFVVLAQAVDPARGTLTASDAVVESALTVDEPGRLLVEVYPADSSTTLTRKLRFVLRSTRPEPLRIRLTARSAGGIRIGMPRGQVHVPANGTTHASGRLWVRSPRLFGDGGRPPFTIEATTGTTATARATAGTRIRPLLPPVAVKLLAILALLALWATAAVVFIPRVVDHVTHGDTSVAASPTTGQTTGVGPGAPAGSDGAGARGTPGATPGGAGGDVAAGTGSAVRVGGTVSGDDPGGVTITMEPTSLVDEEALSAGGGGAAGPVGKLTVGAVLADDAPDASRSRRTTTATDGTWAFADVHAPGYYLLTFAKAGYQTQRFVLDTTKPNPLDVELLAGNGTLTGRVHGPSGGIGGATATITDGTTTITTSSNSTDDIGSWDVAGLSTPGTYLVTVSADGYGTESSLLDLAAGGSQAVDIALRTGVAALTGTVTGPDTSGEVSGLGNVLVTVTDGTITRSATTVSRGPVGQYTLPALPAPGTYTVTFTAPGRAAQTQEVTIAAGVGDQQLDALLLPASGVVNGVITDLDGAGLGGVGLVLTGPEHEYKTLTVSDGTGGYQFTAVEPGTYTLTAQMYGHTTAYAAVDVRAGATTRADLQLADDGTLAIEPTSHIHGRVVDALTGAALTCDYAAPGEKCRATVSTVDHRPDGDVPFELTIEPTEEYVLPPLVGEHPDGLLPGLHIVTVTAPGYESATIKVRVPTDATVDAPLVTLYPEAAIAGTVTTAVGEPVPDGTCMIAAVADGPISGPAPDCTVLGTGGGAQRCIGPEGSACTVVAADGTYRVSGLTKGTYDAWVVPGDPPAGDVDEWVTPDLPTRFTLDRGQTRTYDVVLDRLGRIAVTVSAPNGMGQALLLPGAHVVATNEDTGAQTKADTTESGTAVLPGLATGFYDIAVEDDDGRTAALLGVWTGFNETTAVQTVVSATVGAFWGRVGTRVDDEVVPVAGSTVEISGVTGYAGRDPVIDTGSAVVGTDGCFAVSPDGTPPPDPGRDEDGNPVCLPEDLDPSAIITMALVVNVVDFSAAAPVAGYSTYHADDQLVGAGQLIEALLTPPGSSVAGTLLTFPAQDPEDPLDLSLATITVVDPAPGAGHVVITSAPDGTLTWFDPQYGGQTGLAYPGTYELRASMPGFDTVQTGIVVPLAAPATFDLTIRQHGALQISASDGGTGAPVNGARYTLYDAAGNRVGTQTAGPDAGFVVFADLSEADGPYAVEVRAGGYVFTDRVDHDDLAVQPGETATYDIALTRLGRIIGTVVGLLDAGGASAPLPGAQVTAVRDGTTFTATTGADGTYVLTGTAQTEGLAAGDWVVTFTAPGYDPVGPRTVTVPDGGDALADAALLATAVALTVTIRSDGTGGPLPGATVQLFIDPTGNPVREGTTDERGQIRFADLAPIHYDVVATAKDHQTLTQGVLLDVGAPEQKLTITLAARFNTLAGRVLSRLPDGTTQPLEGAAVAIDPDPEGVPPVTYTDETGSFTIENLPSDDYEVTFSATGFEDQVKNLPIKGGGTHYIGDTELIAVTRQVRVVVDPAGAADVSTMTVRLRSDDWPESFWQGPEPVQRDGDEWVARFNQVLNGSWTAIAEYPDGDVGGPFQQDFDVPDTPGGQVDVTIDVTMQRLSTTADRGDVPPEWGAWPDPGDLTITITDADGAVVGEQDAAEFGEPFALDLPFGSYAATATATGWRRDSADVVLTAGPAQSVHLTLDAERGTLRVTVTSDGTGVDDVEVTGTRSSDAFTVSGKTDDGVVRLTVPPGEWTASATYDGEDQTSAPVNIGDTETVDVELVYGRAGIDATVTQDDVPVSGATVSLRDEDGELVAEKDTDSDGDVAFDGLRLGTYSLVATYQGEPGQERMVTLDANGQRKHVALTVPPATLPVLVTQGGEPAEGASVVVRQGATIVAEGETDDAGKVTFDLPSGTYRVRASLGEAHVSENVTVDAGDNPQLDLELPEALQGFGAFVGADGVVHKDPNTRINTTTTRVTAAATHQCQAGTRYGSRATGCTTTGMGAAATTTSGSGSRLRPQRMQVTEVAMFGSAQCGHGIVAARALPSVPGSLRSDHSLVSSAPRTTSARDQKSG